MDSKKRDVPRKVIGEILHVAIRKALCRRCVPSDLQHETRILRAMVRLGVGRLLALQVPAQVVLDEMGVAFSAELRDFQIHRKKGGTAAGWGLPLALA